MRKLLAIVSFIALSSTAGIGVADAQSVRQVSQTQTTNAPAATDQSRQDWFASAVENILTGTPASQGAPAQGRATTDR